MKYFRIDVSLTGDIAKTARITRKENSTFEIEILSPELKSASAELVAQLNNLSQIADVYFNGQPVSNFRRVSEHQANA